MKLLVSDSRNGKKDCLLKVGMHQESPATGQLKWIFESFPLSWSELFVIHTHNPRRTACFLYSYSLPNVDPGKVSAVFGNTAQLSFDLSVGSGFLRDKEVLFGVAIKENTYFFAVEKET